LAKTKLERAVETQASELNDAQRELVLSQYRDYKRNRERISRIDETLKMIDLQPVVGPDGAKVHLASRMQLADERSRLMEVNNGIAAKLFEQLGGKERR
jgi:hypothetical protein